MKPIARLLVVVLAVLVSLGAAPSQKIKALIIDGQHNHNPQMEGTGAHEPMTWVIPFGNGNVVTCVMGHHMGDAPEVPSLQCIGFQTIVARASEWVATGKISIPIPPNFPTAEKVSLGPALAR